MKKNIFKIIGIILVVALLMYAAFMIGVTTTIEHIETMFVEGIASMEINEQLDCAMRGYDYGYDQTFEYTIVRTA